jgi:hypothetical protein
VPTTYPVPRSSLRNWRAAESVLEKIKHDGQRQALAELVMWLGIHGSPGLDYAVKTTCWLAGVCDDAPVPRERLPHSEARWIDRRVREEIVRLDRGLFPKLRA